MLRFCRSPNLQNERAQYPILLLRHGQTIVSKVLPTRVALPSFTARLRCIFPALRRSSGEPRRREASTRPTIQAKRSFICSTCPASYHVNNNCLCATQIGWPCQAGDIRLRVAISSRLPALIWRGSPFLAPTADRGGLSGTFSRLLRVYRPMAFLRRHLASRRLTTHTAHIQHNLQVHDYVASQRHADTGSAILIRLHENLTERLLASQ